MLYCGYYTQGICPWGGYYSIYAVDIVSLGVTHIGGIMLGAAISNVVEIDEGTVVVFRIG